MTGNVCRKSPPSTRTALPNNFCSRLNLAMFYEMPRVNFYGADATILEYYGLPQLSGSVIRAPKIRFQILTPHSETHTGLIQRMQSQFPQGMKIRGRGT
ncbi:hypothetical protein TNCV_1144021 [Trichonephila clavipes]|nr:hypothetical protein TNCV_1144021 [Trichonephila clavipes]